MALSAGTRLGPYEIREPIGAGGMGEVYRARDTRLGRDVAVKVLPGEVSHTPERLHRFEQEARLAGSLNHPNVLTLFDVGTHDGAPYLVTELLEGRTLREVLEAGPLPTRRAVDHAQQIARGLAAAHAKGIVHRDLKPGNVFVTTDGRVKILDFGLAKLTQVDPGDLAGSQLSTDTAEGRVVGTFGYMAPEQVRGQAVDVRSDIFAFGAVTYEVLTGRRAFVGDTPADTMTAILTKEPEDLSRPGLVVPASLERIVRRCLEKDPEERFQSARDVAFALEAESGTSQTAPVAPPVVPRRRWLRWAAIAALMALAAAAGAWFSRHLWERPLPRFTQLTFRRGTVLSARFTADGNTVVYSALWDGKPPEIFSRRLDRSESVSLGLPPAKLLSVSSQGELAILIAPPGERGVWWQGTLARSPLSGGAIRPLLDDVVGADWSPDGRELAVVRQVEGQYQLEYPIGTVLRRGLPIPAYEFVRVSPDGTSVAVDYGGAAILIVDRTGVDNVLKLATHSFAWLPRGGGLLAVAGDNLQHLTVWQLGMDGTRNEVLEVPGRLGLHDVALDGRLLLHHGFERLGLRARAPGESAERELGVYGSSRTRGVSADGSQLLLVEDSSSVPMTLLRPTRGGQAVRLGDWSSQGLSMDGQWVLGTPSGPPGPSLLLAPTGPGEPIALPAERLTSFWGAFHVEARAVGFSAAEPGRPRRSFWIDLPGGQPRAVTPEGVLAVRGLLPDGSVLGVSGEGSLSLYPLTGGDPRVLPWRLHAGPMGSAWHALQVSGDGRFVYVREGCAPARVDRVEILTGRRVPWRTLYPGDRAGIGAIYPAYITPDGTAYAYSYGEWLLDLYLVEGLRP